MCVSRYVGRLWLCLAYINFSAIICLKELIAEQTVRIINSPNASLWYGFCVFFALPRSAMRCMRVEMSFLFVGFRVLSSSEKHEVYCPFRPHKKKHIIAKVHFECIIVLLFAGARTQWPHVAHYTRGFCCLSAPCTPRCFNATPRPTSVRHDKSPLIF